MNATEEYIKARNEAMLAYPDTTKLNNLIFEYSEYFPRTFRFMWAQATQATKIRTLEKMILDWTGAPLSLIRKVKDAEYDRLMRGFI